MKYVKAIKCWIYLTKMDNSFFLSLFVVAFQIKMFVWSPYPWNSVLCDCQLRASPPLLSDPQVSLPMDLLFCCPHCSYSLFYVLLLLLFKIIVFALLALPFIMCLKFSYCYFHSEILNVA